MFTDFREREKHPSEGETLKGSLPMSPDQIQPKSYVCAMTGNLTRNLFNLGRRGVLQPTEPPVPGLVNFFKKLLPPSPNRLNLLISIQITLHR